MGLGLAAEVLLLLLLFTGEDSPTAASGLPGENGEPAASGPSPAMNSSNTSEMCLY